MPDGIEGLRQFGMIMYRAFQDVMVTEEDLIASGVKVVERSSAAAKHKSALMGAQPANKTVQWTEIHIYRLNEGEIAEHWAEVAMLSKVSSHQVLGRVHAPFPTERGEGAEPVVGSDDV